VKSLSFEMKISLDIFQGSGILITKKTKKIIFEKKDGKLNKNIWWEKIKKIFCLFNAMLICRNNFHHHHFSSLSYQKQNKNLLSR
jgi:hypothetical protein